MLTTGTAQLLLSTPRRSQNNNRACSLVVCTQQCNKSWYKTTRGAMGSHILACRVCHISSTVSTRYWVCGEACVAADTVCIPIMTDLQAAGACRVVTQTPAGCCTPQATAQPCSRACQLLWYLLGSVQPCKAAVRRYVNGPLSYTISLGYPLSKDLQGCVFLPANTLT